MRLPPPHRRRRTVGHRCPLLRRRGFTVIEVVVALLLLLVGALGVVASCAWVARLGSEARLVEAQSRAVQHVLDSARTLPCNAVRAGSASVYGTGVAWGTTHLTQGVQLAVVAAPPARRTRALALEAILPCE